MLYSENSYVANINFCTMTIIESSVIQFMLFNHWSHFGLGSVSTVV